MVFTIPSVPLIGDRNLRRKEVTALLGSICSKTYPSFLTVKEGSTSHLGLLPSGKKRKPLLLVALNRYAIRLADHQRSRQQRSCGLRYATAWIQIAYVLLGACSKLFRKPTWISLTLKRDFFENPPVLPYP